MRDARDDDDNRVWKVYQKQKPLLLTFLDMARKIQIQQLDEGSLQWIEKRQKEAVNERLDNKNRDNETHEDIILSSK